MAKIRPLGDDEPIRLVTTKGGDARYRVTLDAGTHPATGKRRQLTSTHSTLAAAREHVEATRTDLARGALAVPDRQTFSDYAAKWLERKRRSPKVRAVTLRSYAGRVRQAEAVFGAKPLKQVTRPDVESLANAMADDGRAKRTVSLTLFVVHSILADALADGEAGLVRNVAASVEANGKAPRARDFLTGAELARLRSHLATDRLYACWLLTLSGLRRSEVMGLRWSDVDLDAAVPTLSIVRGRVDLDGRRQHQVVGDTKTRRGARTLPLPPDLEAALRSMRQSQAASFGFGHVREGYLAVDEIGEPIRPEWWSDLWREHVVAAGIEAGDRELTLHTARHSSVAAMRRAGISDRVIAQWHGHSESVMVDVYGRHTEVDELAAAGKALSAALS